MAKRGKGTQVKDLSTARVLHQIAYRGALGAYEHLCEDFPPKVVHRKWEMLIDAGIMECGVSTRTAWVTDKGVAVALEHGVIIRGHGHESIPLKGREHW